MTLQTIFHTTDLLIANAFNMQFCLKFSYVYLRHQMTLQTIFHTTDLLINEKVSVHSQKIIFNMVKFLANGKFSYCLQLEEFSLFDSQMINLLYPIQQPPNSQQRNSFWVAYRLAQIWISRLHSRSCSSNNNILLALNIFSRVCVCETWDLQTFFAFLTHSLP
jgi:hypothetical protein